MGLVHLATSALVYYRLSPFLLQGFPPFSFTPLPSRMSSLSQFIDPDLIHELNSQAGQRANTACLTGRWILHQLYYLTGKSTIGGEPDSVPVLPGIMQVFHVAKNHSHRGTGSFRLAQDQEGACRNCSVGRVYCLTDSSHSEPEVD